MASLVSATRSRRDAAARRAGWLLLAVSGGLLIGALGFQFLGDLPPCEMCYWQRYAHLAVLAFAALAIVRPGPGAALLAIAAMLVSAALGGFHVGVEQGLWDGPTACSAPLRTGMSQAEILDTLMKAPLVRCDAVAWSFLGISMAGWNALMSASAAGVALRALKTR
jgi:disulfide bond formation protein DsbB